jgi:hypothetical protein
MSEKLEAGPATDNWRTVDNFSLLLPLLLMNLLDDEIQVKS